jgi:hypothetical protein
MGSLLGKALSVVAVLLVIVSCVSTQRSQDEASTQLFADLINSGQADKLVSMSAVPFLVDQEIVSLAADVGSFWRTLVQSGYGVGAASLTIAFPVSDSSYREFADTVEVNTFFAKYVTKGTRLLELKTATGKRILLLVKDELFGKKIICGFRGPF